MVSQFHPLTIKPGISSYPVAIASRFSPAPVLHIAGELSILNQSSLGLLCSAKAPASIMLSVHDLAQRWRYGPQVIISGFHSPVEQEAFAVLLRGPGRVVYVPARGLPKRLKPAWKEAIAEGRLVILSPFPDSVRRATKETAVFRNRVVAALADEALVAYAYPGSSTEQLVKEVLGWGKSVYTLPHGSTNSLRALGVKILV